MKQQSENAYDDDLTVGTDEMDDSYYSEPVDLFEFSTDIEAPISRLKTLVLSIDWEITDDILVQFSEELQELKETWAGEKVNLVYVQALEKICRYIYQKKADSHPNSIKLLLNLFHNLERIVTDETLGGEEKKKLLVDDVRRFENLKRAISRKEMPASPPLSGSERAGEKMAGTGSAQLEKMKALILAIDWEVGDTDLASLQGEVSRLEKQFADSRPARILLQGIATLTGYLKAKGAKAHGNTLELLQFFYQSLEKVAGQGKEPEEERAILFPAVERFNAFKAAIDQVGEADDRQGGATAGHRDGATAQAPPPRTAPVVEEDDEEDEDEEGLGESAVVTPALSDVSDEVICGFQADLEAKSLGLAAPDHILSRVDDFFADEPAAAPAAQSMAPPPAGQPPTTVPTPVEPPAVEVNFAKESEIAEQDRPDGEVDVVAQFFADGLEEESAPASAPPSVERSKALEGVAVESDADEDDDEPELPKFGDEPAPALADRDEVSLYNAELVAAVTTEDEEFDEVAGTVDGFFATEETPAAAQPPFAGEAMPLSLEEEEGQQDAETPAADDRDESIAAATDGDGLSMPSALPESSQLYGEAMAPAQLEMEETAPTDPELEEVVVVDPELEETAPTDPELEEVAMEEKVSPEVAAELVATDTAALPEVEAIEPPTEMEMAWPGVDGESVAEEEEVVDGEVVFAPVLDEEFSAPVEDADEELPLVVPEPDEADEAEEADEVEISGGDEEGDVAEETDEVETSGGDEEGDETEEVDEAETPGEDEEGDYPAAVGILAGLRAAIQTLATDPEERRTAALFQEIHFLRGRFAGRPVEKSFLQLLSTVGQHIDRHGQEYGGGVARDLLRSVSDALALCLESPAHGQELLLPETLKVLEWQQTLLSELRWELRREPVARETLAATADGAAQLEEPAVTVADLHQELVGLRLELAELRRELRGKASMA